MGWKELAASVISDVLSFAGLVIGHVLSWPVVFFVVVLVLLNPIRRLIGRLKTAKGFGSEVEFLEETILHRTAQASTDVSELRERDEADEGASPPARAAPTDDSGADPATPDSQRSSDSSTDTDASDETTPTDTAARYSAGKRAARGASEGRYDLLRSPSTRRSLYTGKFLSVFPEKDGELSESPEWARARRLAETNPRSSVLAAWASLSTEISLLHAVVTQGGRARSNEGMLEELANYPFIPRSFLSAVASLQSVKRRAEDDSFELSSHLAFAFAASAMQLEEMVRTLLQVNRNDYNLPADT